MSITNIYKQLGRLGHPLTFFHLFFVVIVLLNTHVGAFFTGWDALNPEFNILFNIKQALFSTWQENYGTGALTGHGFGATLPHTLSIAALKAVLPLWAVRPVFTLMMYYLGGLGIFLLTRKILKKILQNENIASIRSYTDYISLIPSLFYLVNLGTVQIFYVQLEAFIVQFAFLPWIYLTLINALDRPSRKDMFLFMGVNLLASVQGFIPSLFLSFLIGLGLFLVVYARSKGFSKNALKKCTLIFLSVLCINAYWLFPFTYSQLSGDGTFLSSYNNMISTPDFIAKSNRYGTISNTMLQKSFLLETYHGAVPIFKPWIDYYHNPAVQGFAYGLFFITAIGFLTVLTRATHWALKGCAILALFYFLSITTNTPPFSYFTEFLYRFSPIYAQAFRTTFTKFGIGLSFSYSIFLGIGTVYLMETFMRNKNNVWHKATLYMFIMISIIVLSLPMLSGNLLYNRLMFHMPQAYLDIIDYFKTQEDGRIADLPQECPEGWYGYSWGYFGSGFYWYGIRQPILSRSFDVWSRNNENYYWEISQALRTENIENVRAVFEKYNVTWVLYDQNFLHCRNQKAFFNNDAILKGMLTDKHFSLEKTFTSQGIEPLYLFRIKNETAYETARTYISLGNDLRSVGPMYDYADYDAGFQENGHYETSVATSYDTYYPFRPLFSKREPLTDSESDNSGTKNLTLEDEVIRFHAPVNLHSTQGSQGYELIIPSFMETESTIPVEVFISDDVPKELSISVRMPELYLKGEKIFPQDNQNDSALSPIIIGSFPQDSRFLINGKEYDGADIDSGLTTLFSVTGDNSLVVMQDQGAVLFSWDSSESEQFQSYLTSRYRIVLPYYEFPDLTLLYPRIEEKDVYGFKNIQDIVPISCGDYAGTHNTYQKSATDGNEFIRLISKDNRQCLTYHFPALPTSQSYLFFMRYRNVAGQTPFVTISNNQNIHFSQTYLPPEKNVQSYSFIIPKSYPDEIGLTMTLENYSLTQDPAVNDVFNLAVWPISYNYLTHIRLENIDGGNARLDNDSGDKEKSEGDDEAFDKNTNGTLESLEPAKSVKHPSTVMYIVENADPAKKRLVLFQSFHKGWKAYGVSHDSSMNRFLPFVFGKALQNHTLVNNWANGWNLETGYSTYVIIFWPQYMQYLGFITTIATTISIFIYGLTRHRLGKQKK